MLLVFTGNGKGKTTAAIGQGIRALGQGKRVFMIQFIKSRGYPSGEDLILTKLGEKFVFKKGGRGFVGILGDKLPRRIHRAAALKTLAEGERAIRSGKYDLVILDEINVALGLKLIPKARVLKLARNVPDNVDVIFTGRGGLPEAEARAALVTRCEDVKHPFRGGAKAKSGMEY
ncbi:MAG: cob(I)yrinic acid a,c-diamide adenosyltransferase [Candidatus Jorgensenbacteria bacterium]